MIGGLILEGLSWRWIFYVNVPIGFAALALASVLPALEPQPGERLDLVGVALAVTRSRRIVFGLSEIATHGGIGYVGDGRPIVTGLVLVALFAVHALRTSGRPLLDLTGCFANPASRRRRRLVMLVGAALFGSLMLVIPLYLQVVRGLIVA